METPIAQNEGKRRTERRRGTAFDVSRIWLVIVLGIFAYQGAFRAEAQGPMDAQIVYVLVFSGYTASVLVVRQALERTSWLNVALGTLAGIILAALGYLYFPMGPAECYDWVQESVREGRYTIP